MQLSQTLLSVLGKTGRIKILETLYKFPKRAFTINELARESGVPVMSCWRGVKEFEDLQIVRVDAVGKTFAVRLNEKSSIVNELKHAKLSDVHRDSALRFAKALRRTNGVSACFLFGSVSTSAHKSSSDVDIAIVYNPKKVAREALEEICTKLTKESLKTSGMRIIPFYMTVDELKDESKSIVKNILAGELLWKKGR